MGLITIRPTGEQWVVTALRHDQAVNLGRFTKRAEAMKAARVVAQNSWRGVHALKVADAYKPKQGNESVKTKTKTQPHREAAQQGAAGAVTDMQRPAPAHS